MDYVADGFASTNDVVLLSKERAEQCASSM